MHQVYCVLVLSQLFYQYQRQPRSRRDRAVEGARTGPWVHSWERADDELVSEWGVQEQVVDEPVQE